MRARRVLLVAAFAWAAVITRRIVRLDLHDRLRSDGA